MNLHYLIQKVYHEPALITPSAHAAIRQLLESRLLDASGEVQAAREGEYCGEKVELDGMEIKEGVAHIPIAGAIGSKLSGFAKYRGAVDVADVENELDEAEDSDEVKAILLDIDSPGGMVLGTPELADRIAQVEKPIMAFSNGMIASAAYWLASATDGIFTTRTAETGSIGVYMPVVDKSQAFAAMGVKVELIKAGKFKGMGFPGVSLTDAQREHLQAEVNQIYGMFTEHVRQYRGDVSSETMQGQMFMGPESVRVGLADGIVKNKGEAVQILMQS